MGILVAGLSVAPEVILASALTLAICLYFSQTEVPPVLFIGLLNLWLIASLQVLYFCVYGQQALDAAHQTATLYSLAAVLALIAGIRIASSALPRRLRVDNQQRDADIRRIDTRKLFRLYLIAWALNFSPLSSLPLSIPGIGQLLLPLFTLKWALFFLICVAGLKRKDTQNLMISAFLLEFFAGISGFWGGFIQFIFFFGTAFFYARPSYRTQHYVSATMLVLLIAALAVRWTAIKPQYREFVSGGTNAQVVSVGLTERLTVFFDMMTSVSDDNLAQAEEQFVRRAGYIDPFADTVNYIPQSRPYGEGEILQQSIAHVVMPRFLFPDKKPLDDSEITRRYSGRNVAGVESNTSISIGYFGESYADWGFPGMLILILGLGAVFRICVALIVSGSPNRLMGEAVAVGGLLPVFIGVHSTPKLLGFLIISTTVLTLLATFLGSWLSRQIGLDRDPRLERTAPLRLLKRRPAESNPLD